MKLLTNDVEYRTIGADEINRKLFSDFRRRQKVTTCLRLVDGTWRERDDPFVDDWSEKDYRFLIECLRNTLRKGGAVFGAFIGGSLKGFASVEGEFFGKNSRYLDLSSLHVSEELRGNGIGNMLFQQAKQWAKSRGADKLYISSHSAIESQAFYRAMLCTDASEPNAEHIKKEPFDRQLECGL